MRNLNEKKDCLALELLGKAFIKLPRAVSNRAFVGNWAKNLCGRLHLALICLCRFTDGYVMLNGKKETCFAGEYVGTHQDLADCTGIAVGSIYRLLKQLSAENLIEVTVIEGGSRIRVCGYTQYILAPELLESKGKIEPVKKSITRFSDYHGIDPNIPFT